MTYIDPDSVAPMFTTDGVEIYKGMDVYVVENNHWVNHKVDSRSVIALSKVNRYIITKDSDGDEHKYKFTDDYKMTFFSTLEKAKQHNHDALIKSIADVKSTIYAQQQNLIVMEERWQKQENELNANKHLESVILGVNHDS